MVLLLRHASETTKEEYERLVEGAPMLRRAYDELERCSWRELELNTYEQIRKRALDNAAALHCKLQEGMAMGEERGVKKGKQEGIAIGEEKGIAIGKEEGREERNIEIAKNMLSRKLSVELIAGVTGLSLEQISELK